MLSQKHKSSAKVVDGSLVLSLPDAVTPVVMRLSLEEAKSAALGVEEKDEKFILVVKFSEKEQREIAPYDNRESAVDALMAASAALEKGSRQAVAGNANDNAGGSNGAGALKWVGAFGVLAVLIYIISSMGSGLPQAPSAPRASAASPSVGAPPAQGVPMSADAFLSRR